MTTLNTLLVNITAITEKAINQKFVVEEFGGYERAVKVIVGVYCNICREHNTPIKMLDGAENLIRNNIEDYKKTSKWID